MDKGKLKIKKNNRFFLEIFVFIYFFVDNYYNNNS
jgi:hypothetical protein